jgi:hypothetical protein
MTTNDTATPPLMPASPATNYDHTKTVMTTNGAAALPYTSDRPSRPSLLPCLMASNAGHHQQPPALGTSLTHDEHSNIVTDTTPEGSSDNVTGKYDERYGRTNVDEGTNDKCSNNTDEYSSEEHMWSADAGSGRNEKRGGEGQEDVVSC